MKRALVLHILAFLLAFAAFSQAQAFPSCELLFRASPVQPLKLSDESIFTFDEKQKVARLLVDESKTVSQRWADVLEIYRFARVRMFPQQHQAKIARMLHSFRPTFSDQVREPELNTGRMVFPSAYEQTALPAIVTAHEWEHYIRTYMRSGRTDGSGTYGTSFVAPALYIEERAAMRAEWEIAHLMTSEEAKSLRQTVRQSSRDAQFITKVETNAQAPKLNRDEYILAMHEIGRYSKLDSLKRTAFTLVEKTWLHAYLGGSAIGTCSFIYWLIH